MKHQLLALVVMACLTATVVQGAERKRIYIANDDHTDYMWTADADTYSKVFVKMLDWHMKLGRRDGWTCFRIPEPLQHRRKLLAVASSAGSPWLHLCGTLKPGNTPSGAYE